MSAKHVYMLVCDGGRDGCLNFYSDNERAHLARDEASEYGWTTRTLPPEEGVRECAKALDLCPQCSAFQDGAS